MNKKTFIKILILQVFVVSCFCFFGKTAIAAAPTVSSFSPVDNNTYVASSTDLVITFSENIFVDSGNIYIKKADDNSVFETIDVASNQVTISGATTTINPSSLLERGVAYYIQIDSTCFKNAGEEYYAGISDATTWDFIIYNDLYVTELVKDINVGGHSHPSSFIVMNDVLYFQADDGTNGIELWKSDGTDIGTVMVEDINVSGNSSPNYLTVMNNEIYFQADGGLSGIELWKSDGTAVGTVMVKNINTTFSQDSSPSYLTLMNNEIYFWASNGYSPPSTELYKSDGTDSGTAMVKNIDMIGGSTPVSLTVMNNELYFSADDGAGSDVELWKSDGTGVGTVMVKNINTSGKGGGGDSNPSSLTVMNNELYFSADDGTNGVELWKSDSTATGTVMIKDINNGSGDSSPACLTVMNNELYFQAGIIINGVELWKSDGTASGTVMVKDIDGSGSGSPDNLTVMNNELYFSGSNFSGTELWKSDGTESGTTMVKNIKTTIFAGSNPDNLTVMNNELYFSADDGTNGIELWKTDGTANGTAMVKDINTSGNSTTSNLTVMNNELYFSADDGTNGIELWKTYIITSPVVLSNSSVSVSLATATLSGEIQSIGRQNNTERGFVWSSETASPTVNDSSTSQTGSFGVGSFSATISGLNCATTYYFRAYSVNRAGISYGDSASFTTEACPPSLPPDAHKPPKKPKKDKDGEEVEVDFRIIINDGENKTKERTVNLELIAGEDTVNMALSEDPEFTYASIEPYQAEKEFILSEGEGIKTVYVKFYTQWGQSSEVVSDDIYYQEKEKEKKEEKEPKDSGETMSKKQSPDILNGLLGRIIFQTGNKDRIWYVNPMDEKKYSIENPFRIFNVMSCLSLGTIHEYINKYLEFPKRVLGRILLDVEENGEAYYINPIDKKKYYLGRPKDAFDIMKGFGTEISDSDIEKIEIGEVKIKD